MSKQGNIAVIDDHGNKTVFTSGRWGGTQMLRAAQEALSFALADGVYDPCSDCLASLCKNGNISHPIFTIGNADVPSIKINFFLRRVFIYDEGRAEIIKTYKFTEFKDMGKIQELFE